MERYEDTMLTRPAKSKKVFQEYGERSKWKRPDRKPISLLSSQVHTFVEGRLIKVISSRASSGVALGRMVVHVQS